MASLRPAFALLLLVPGALAAQQAASAPTGAFVVRLGTDTIAVERFTRRGDTWAVEQARRSPRTGFYHTHLELTPSGDIGTIFFMNHGIGKDAPPLIATWKLTAAGGDSGVIEARRGDSTRTRRTTLRPGMIPSLPESFLPYELAAARLRRAGADSMAVTLAGPHGDTMPIVVRRLGADSMTFTLPFLTYRARVDADGRVQSLYVPLGTSVERVSDVDVSRLAESWSALDAAGKGMGALSPLDSATASVGAARIAVRYSRPKARGRVVFGSMVPWGAVWRTGANAATVLSTDRDLDIGGTRVPAGRYSLFTVHTERGATLIINRQTEQDGRPLQGTDHDPKHDLARIAARVRTLAEPVEQFTIDVVPQGSDRGLLRLRWERREMTVPVRVR